MKKNILFLPASIRSHIVPALYLADILEEESEIYFAVTSSILEDIVTNRGYKTIITSTFRIALGMETRFVIEKKGKNNQLEIIRAIRDNDILKYRQTELGSIIDSIKPTTIIIDIFNSTDFVALYPKYPEIKYIFLNPMLSTYRIRGFPTVERGEWKNVGENYSNFTLKRKIELRDMITRPINSLINKLTNSQLEKFFTLPVIVKNHPIASDATNTLLFDNIPEIILAPVELEFDVTVRKLNQHYLGLCVSECREDTELDLSFTHRFEEITAAKNSKTKLIYCTFGTFYQGSDRALLDFLNKLIDAIETLENVVVVFSVNSLVIETLKFQRIIPDYIYMFEKVPQLEVLKIADLFVTHGGLGSVKESIYYEVPMLVYPLDLHYDQNGNGLKVEFHELGLRGVFHSERAEDMSLKMIELMSNPHYKNNISLLKRSCLHQYAPDRLNETLNQLIF